MICDYGCDQNANHQFQNGKWCCSKHFRSCPAQKNKIVRYHKGVKRSKKSKNNMRLAQKKLGIKRVKKTKRFLEKAFSLIGIEPCTYCGARSKYYFKPTKTYCCVEHWSGCPANKKEMAKRNKGIRIIIDKICEYGCNKKANFIQQNGKYSCGKYPQSCKGIRKKNSIGQKYNAEQWRERYPFFAIVEEIKNGEEPGEILVHCKNSKCLNSKENGGWFKPHYHQFIERVRDLEISGKDTSYYYCSEECKKECTLFGKTVNQLIKENEQTIPYKEYQLWRKLVLKRDEYACQYCTERAEHVHHIQPKKTHPLFSLDPDNGLSVCKKCHFKYGHKDECSTGQLARKICKE
ncbi:HNH endonuclease [Candidatus Pacearchaeota archaeon]|nr:HNH endonuclease [Candidatus Pacearchaeota archaeon]